MPEEKKDELVHLTIDDIPIAVPPGTLVWAAAQQAGIEIPIYCYHPKMPPLGACRMCFVEIEKVPKPPQTACTTPVSSEISMDNGLVMISRGYKMEVGTAPDQAFDSIFSGNTVEMCPVGALTATAYRFKARPWELKRTPSVCNNCSVGCNVRVDV